MGERNNINLYAYKICLSGTMHLKAYIKLFKITKNVTKQTERLTAQ